MRNEAGVRVRSVFTGNINVAAALGIGVQHKLYKGLELQRHTKA